MRVRFGAILSSLYRMADDLGSGAFLSAAKADDLKKKYPDIEEEIDLLAESDPTPTKKYLDWSVRLLLKQAEGGVFDTAARDFVQDIVDMVARYHEALPRLEGRDRDIGSFKSLDDMEDAVLKAESKETKGDTKKKARKGGIVLYEDKRWMLVHPVTMDGSIYYGTNTSWCVSRRHKESNYFYSSYTAGRNVQFYFLIDKKAEQYNEEVSSRGGRHFSKVAMLFSEGKPDDREPFQDAANRAPSKRDVREAIGHDTFDKLYNIAHDHAKKHPNTWAWELLHVVDNEAAFNKLYEENAGEIQYLNKEEVIKSAVRCKAITFILKVINDPSVRNEDILNMIVDSNPSDEVIYEIVTKTDFPNITLKLASSPNASERTLLAILKNAPSYWESSIAVEIAKNPSVFNYKKVTEALLNFKKNISSFQRTDNGADVKSYRPFYYTKEEAEKLSDEEKTKQNNLARLEIVKSFVSNPKCDNDLLVRSIDFIIKFDFNDSFYDVVSSVPEGASEQHLLTVLDYLEKDSFPHVEYQKVVSAVTDGQTPSETVIGKLYDYLKKRATEAIKNGLKITDSAYGGAYFNPVYDEPVGVLYAINMLALSHKTTEHVLRDMLENAESIGVNVSSLALNPKLPAGVIDYLSKNREYSSAIVNNTSITPTAISNVINVVLDGYSVDEEKPLTAKDKTIIGRLVRNENFTGEDYEKLLNKLPIVARKDFEASTMLVSNEVLSSSVLDKIAKIILELSRNNEVNISYGKYVYDKEDFLIDAIDKILKNKYTYTSTIDTVASEILTSNSKFANYAVGTIMRGFRLPSKSVMKKLADENNWNPKIEDRGEFSDDARALQKRAASSVAFSALNASIEKLHAIEASPSVLLAMEEAASLLSAAKADDLMKKYPEQENGIRYLADQDPTPTKKYLEWSVKMLLTGADFLGLADAVKQYDSLLPRLQGSDRDINSFKSLRDLKDVIEEAKGKETKGDLRKKAKKGGEILFEDDRWQLVHPTTMDGSIYYGSNTSWCVSRREKPDNYFYKYVGDNVQFYFLIDKQAEQYDEEVSSRGGHHFSKVAMLFSEGKPYAKERFQDAANRRPTEGDVRSAVGDETFDKLYAIAQRHAKSNPTTWLSALVNATDKKQFSSIFEEHASEVPQALLTVIKVALRVGALDLVAPHLKGANLTNAYFYNADLAGANLTNANLMGANLMGAILTNANLTNANLNGAVLRGAKLEGADLTNAFLYGAKLIDAKLIDAYLKGAKLIDAYLEGANLEGANLTNADLTEAKLVDAKLMGAKLINADLNNATLTNANLNNAILTNAVLISANLRGANLTNANLTNTDLTGANLGYANLTDAKLEGAKLRGIKYNDETVWPEGFTPPSQSAVTTARLDASIEKLHDIKASPLVLLAMEEAAELLSAANVGGLDRNRATTVMIPIPKHLAARFPGAEHNNGHEPHLTVCFLSADKDMTVGKASEALAIIRRVCRRQAPFRMALDVNSGLHDFGPSEMGSKALWFDIRQDPDGVLDKLHRAIKNALKLDGIPVDSRHSYHPHVTWRYVSNDQSEGDRQRMSAFAASRFNDLTTTWFDVKHLILSMPDGSQKAIALSPRLR